ncbi:MAG: hypothetical protein NTW29_20050 [Bacteroidetes bacterium]|nr:hypothetical protein [Bacteroidota bacterium]
MTQKLVKPIILMSILLTGIVSFGQKTYKVDKAIWTYTKPENYRTRVDNFSSSMKKGDSIIKQNVTLSKQANDDNILISVAKSDSSDINVIMADYKNNSNIKKFTLKGYISKLIEFMKYNYKKIGSDATIKTREVVIDKVKFSVIETKIFHKDKNFTYWTTMYIAELSNKEFSILATYDNEKDKKVIEQSILKSKFIIR